jgi:hypothetical protein
MALQGTLKDFSLADIFQLIGIQKKTGVLTLKSDPETVTVSFVDGNVVGADSTVRRLEDRLGTVLVKSGRLSESQLQEALRLQRSQMKRLGTILVEGQFVDRTALSEALQVQISQMVYRLFRWTAGSYQFSQETKVDYDRDLVAPMSAESILMEGARILDEWPMIEKGIRSMQAVWKHANVEIAKGAGKGSGEEAAGTVTLSDSERDIYALVDGKRPVQEIVDRSTSSEFDTCRILYDLISRQLLEETRVAAPARPGPAVVAKPGRRLDLGPIAAGFLTLILVLGAGGALLVRLLPEMARWREGRALLSSMTPFLSSGDESRVATAMARSRLQGIDSALQVYYLLNRGYPDKLMYLVNDGLMEPGLLLDSDGAEISYGVTSEGYRLQTTTGIKP